MRLVVGCVDGVMRESAVPEWNGAWVTGACRDSNLQFLNPQSPLLDIPGVVEDTMLGSLSLMCMVMVGEGESLGLDLTLALARTR